GAGGRGLEDVGAALCLEAGHGVLDQLRMGAGGDEEGVGGVNDHHVLDADEGDDTGGVRDDDAAAVVGEDAPALPDDLDVLVFLGAAEAGDGCEVADVVPAEVGGDDCHVAGVGCGLGHGVVDGDLGQGGPDAVLHGDPVRGVPGAGNLHDAVVEGGLV